MGWNLGSEEHFDLVVALQQIGLFFTDIGCGIFHALTAAQNGGAALNLTIVLFVVFFLYQTATYWLVRGFFGLLLSLFQISTLAMVLVAIGLIAPESLKITGLSSLPGYVQFIVIALIVHALIYVPRFLIGIHAGLRTKSDQISNDVASLLPSQAEVVRRLFDNCGGVPFNENQSNRGSRNTKAGRTPHEGQLVTLEAGWGRGKTYVLRKFQELAKPKGAFQGSDTGHDFNLVVSYYNAWSNQAERDPEFAIVKHLIADRRVVWPYGWIALPAYRIFFAGFSNALFGGASFKLDTSMLKMEGAGSTVPSAVKWSGFFEDLAQVTFRRSHRRRGAGLVVVVDDVDRCTPATAQRYVTLFRRGLNVPNLSIVFPYASDQLRYKVFDPISSDLPDLGSSMEAAFVGMISNANKDFGIGTIGSADYLHTSMRDGFSKLFMNRIAETAAVADGRKDADIAANASWPNAMNRWELLRRELLNETHAELRSLASQNSTDAGIVKDRLEKLMRQLESKYVSDAPIILKPISYPDAVQIMIGLSVVRDKLFQGGEKDQVYSVIKAALDGKMTAVIPTAALQGTDQKLCDKPCCNPYKALTDKERQRVETMLDQAAFEKRVKPLNDEAVLANPLANPLENPPSIRSLIASSSRDMQVDSFANTISPTVGSGGKFDMERLIQIIVALDIIYLNGFDYMFESEGRYV